VSRGRPVKSAVVNIYLTVLYSLLPLSICGSQTVIQYIRDQINSTPFADVAVLSPCGQSTSNKPGSSPQQAIPSNVKDIGFYLQNN